MKDLLVLFGKRVKQLRAARDWSQEEFAHVCGLHRTYIGQVERGEKNISFGNLVKLSSALDVALSELLSRLDDGSPAVRVDSKRKRGTGRDRPLSSERRLFEIRKLMKRLRNQRAALDRTIFTLEELADASGNRTGRSGQQGSKEN